MDLLFPHHESEIAQSDIANGEPPVKYWMHCNMITVNGKKMGKSYGNTITLRELFSGNHPLLEQAYSPMTIRFFILQTHYRSTLDFGNESLQAAEKGLQRLLKANEVLKGMQYPEGKTSAVNEEEELVIASIKRAFDNLYDDINTAMCMAELFNLVPKIFSWENGQLPLASISRQTFQALQQGFTEIVEQLFGLKPEVTRDDHTDKLVQLLIEMRKKAKSAKDFATADKIRQDLLTAGIKLKDGKDGSTGWERE